MTNTTESSIDFPQAQLCPEVWEEVMDAFGANKTWKLVDDARRKILQLSKYLMEKLNVENYAIHIIGSITSNQYTSSSDVDVHFVQLDESNVPVTLDEDVQETYTQLIRDDFKNYYMLQFPEDSVIGSHPIEVFFQKSIYQSYTSVGCYDVLRRKWLVGPSFKDLSFNPYSEYYKDIQNAALKGVSKIRNQILAVYEAAVLYHKNSTAEFAQTLVEELSNAAEMLINIKDARNVIQIPTSVEDALQKRESKDWKIADASFKLLDKFGYIGILKEFSSLAELAVSDAVLEEIAQAAINAVKTKLGDKQKLEERELDLMNEGMKEWSMLAAICAMIAIPGIMPYSALAAQFKNIPKNELKINSTATKKAMKNATTAKEYNGLSAPNIINAVARTIYAEGKGESDAGRAAIASVIWNRAEKDPANFISVISKPSQFSCWRKYAGGWKDSSYAFRLPYLNDQNSVAAKAIWENCMDLAVRMYNKSFKSTIGNRNFYLNKNKAVKKVVDKYSDMLDLKIDNQYFGYVEGTNSFNNAQKPQNKTYIVKKGDTLSDIAKANRTTVDEIASKNNITDINSLRIGQILSI